MTRRDAWIDVYPIEGRKTTILCPNTTVSGIKLNKELSDYVDNLWKPKKEKGWTSSYVAFAKEVEFENEGVFVYADAMQFHQISGMNEAIKNKKPFAPEQRYINCLSVGFLTATKDAKVIFQRRPNDVHCPNTLIQEPCGYMATRNFLPKSEHENPKFTADPRLYSLEVQLEKRREELAGTLGVSPLDINYDTTQDFLAAGWLTQEMYFSTIGKVNAEQKDLKLGKGEFVFVPFENVKDLIYNQGKLSKTSPIGYRPEDPRYMPIIDESLTGLIWGYEKLTGDKLDSYETVERLNNFGMDIRVLDTSSGKGYKFPVQF